MNVIIYTLYYLIIVQTFQSRNSKVDSLNRNFVAKGKLQAMTMGVSESQEVRNIINYIIHGGGGFFNCI